MAAARAYEQLTETCFAAAIGEGGLRPEEFEPVLADCAPALADLRARRGELAFLRAADRRDDIADIEAAAHRYREAFESLVVLGTGGSSLGGRALCALAQPMFGGGAVGDRIYFVENVDPRSLTELLRALDLRRTGFIAISKSGRTPEVLAQFLVCLDIMADAVDAERVARHFVVVTEDEPNPLRRLARHRAIRIFDHDPGLPGRYSALSITGALPAGIAGLDIGGLRAGASAAIDACLGAVRPADAAPAVGAAINVALMRRRGVAATVLMPYDDALVPFASWFRQLWAESLGKDAGGTTPIRAAGTVDQHSQLQLYLGGRPDKMFTLIATGRQAEGVPIGRGLEADVELDWLLGRTMGDLLEASCQATAEALAEAGRPVRILRLAVLDAGAMGAMMMHFMLETVITAHLLGVNPFDQPAVESGKRRIRRLLGAIPPRQE